MMMTHVFRPRGPARVLANVRPHDPRRHSHAGLSYCGQAAKTFADQWLASHGPTLRVRTFKDRTEKFGRWLVEIEDPESGEGLGEQLVAAGHAKRVDW